MAILSPELQQHLADNPHIEKVYFDAGGNHYFNVHELDGEWYGRIVSDIHGNLSDAQASEPHRIMEVHSTSSGPWGNTLAPETKENGEQKEADTTGEEPSGSTPEETATPGSDNGAEQP